MTSVVFYFQCHQPYRLRHISSLDVGKGVDWFDDSENARIVERVAERCYLPMNQVLLDLIEDNDGKFRCSFALTGTLLSQLEEWAPAALDSFVTLANTGSVEFIAETERHSVASQGDLVEWERQVRDHARRLEDLFGRRPTTVRNTELIYDNTIAKRFEDLGFEAVLAEGADQLLDGRSPRRVYRPRGCSSIKLLLRDYEFSDDIAFRFSNKEWPDYPLMADTFASWLHRASAEDEFIGLFMDYETFGEHQWEETGILDFMRHVPRYVLEDPRFSFETPHQVAARFPASEEIDAPRPLSWADAERDLSAWLGSHMQRAAHDELYAMADEVRALAATGGHDDLVEAWRRLTTSDHVYYMSTKFMSDGDVHEYFSPYESPHDAFVTFMNVLEDLKGRIADTASERKPEAGS